MKDVMRAAQNVGVKSSTLEAACEEQLRFLWDFSAAAAWRQQWRQQQLRRRQAAAATTEVMAATT